MRRSIVVLLCIGMLISWQIWQGDIVCAKEKMEKPKGKAFECSIAGTWRRGTGDGFSTFIPIDAEGRRFSVMIDGPIPEDPTLFEVFPKAKALSQSRGIAVKASRNLYKFTVTQIAVDIDEDGTVIPLGEFEVSGLTKLIDCNKRVVSYSFRFLNTKGEDVFQDAGGYCGLEAETTYEKRYEIVRPCDKLLPFIEDSEQE